VISAVRIHGFDLADSAHFREAFISCNGADLLVGAVSCRLQ
jgi:hypothetical protein